MYFKFIAAFFALVGSVFASDLKKFDIEVIAPSSGLPEQGLPEKLAKKITQLLGNMKIDVPIGGSEAQVFADENAKFLKLDKSLRSNHKILWALRGGYGADKLMPFVVHADYSKVFPKIIIGYSDLTPLMIHLSQKYGWIAVNAPMLKDFVLGDKSKQSYQSIINFLNNICSCTKNSLKISDLKPINDIAKSKGIVAGKVTGGNITCIISTIGTPWQIETSGKIVFLEDTNVTGFRLDRLLTHMKNAGLFRNAKAIIFGDFGADVVKVLKRFASKLNIPVYKSSSFGHGNTSLPFVYNYTGTIQRIGNKTEVEMREHG